jgi:hypothetical protein
MDAKEMTVDCCPDHLPENIVKNMSGPLANGMLRKVFIFDSADAICEENFSRLNALHNAVAYYSTFVANIRSKGKDGNLPSHQHCC